MLRFSYVLKPIKIKIWSKKEKKGRNTFRTGAKMYFREKNILGLGALCTLLFSTYEQEISSISHTNPSQNFRTFKPSLMPTLKR